MLQTPPQRNMFQSYVHRNSLCLSVSEAGTRRYVVLTNTCCYCISASRRDADCRCYGRRGTIYAAQCVPTRAAISLPWSETWGQIARSPYRQNGIPKLLTPKPIYLLWIVILFYFLLFILVNSRREMLEFTVMASVSVREPPHLTVVFVVQRIVSEIGFSVRR
jgi:hypothetical protein